MKRILTWIIELKNVAAMAFAGMVMAYVVFSGLWGVNSLRFSYIWQMLFISLIFAVLQYIFLSGEIVKKSCYPLRMLLFTASLYLVLSSFAVGFGWFAHELRSWGIFTLVFFGFFGIMTAVFELYSHMTGIRYNRRLEAYKAEQGQ